MCNFVLVGNGMYTVYIVFAGKIKLNFTVYLCVLSIKTIFSNILQHTYVCTVCSKCNTEPKKGLSHYDEWRRSVLHSS